MATKFKGIYKGFKYITQIFVVKEREMEIGYPTDVKHVAHIGWDGASGNAPSWMNEFKSPPDFSTSTIGNPRDTSSFNFSPWSSQDYDHQSIGSHSVSNGFKDTAPITDRPSIPKKQKRKKKTSSTSSPKSSAGRSRTSRAAKSKPALHDLDSPVFQV